MNELIRLVTEMRNAQKLFFKEQKQSHLIATKAAERRVDRWLKKYNDQKDLAQAVQLFPRDEGI